MSTKYHSAGELICRLSDSKYKDRMVDCLYDAPSQLPATGISLGLPKPKTYSANPTVFELRSMLCWRRLGETNKAHEVLHKVISSCEDYGP